MIVLCVIAKLCFAIVSKHDGLLAMRKNIYLYYAITETLFISQC